MSGRKRFNPETGELEDLDAPTTRRGDSLSQNQERRPTPSRRSNPRLSFIPVFTVVCGTLLLLFIGNNYVQKHYSVKSVSTTNPVTQSSHFLSGSTPETSSQQQHASSHEASPSTFPGERFPETRNGILSKSDVESWSDDKLRYAINEMYARHGADFRDKDIKRHFSSFSWYRPRSGKSYDNAEAEFSDIEKGNVDFLGSYRTTRKELGQNISTSSLTLDQERSLVQPGFNPLNAPSPIPATTAKQASPSSGPRYTGNGRVYKVPELKDLVGRKLDNAWLYGDFLLKDVKDNVGFFITTAIFLLPKEGSTQVQIEFPNGIVLSRAAVNTLRDPMLVLPVSFWAKDPLQLLSVNRLNNGRLLVKARARGALRL